MRKNRLLQQSDLLLKDIGMVTEKVIYHGYDIYSYRYFSR